MKNEPAHGSLAEAALELQNFCEAHSWKFCFIGGLAVQAWSLPRATVDADITLLTGFGGEEAFIDTLLGHFHPRIENAREFAIWNRVLLLRSTNGRDLDIGLGALPFEENSVQRSSKQQLTEDLCLRVCSAEDLVIHKAFASRDQDWADVDGILMRRGEHLDLDLIFKELTPLVALKEEPQILERLRAMMVKRGVAKF